jgi:DNA-binding phage protein
METTEAVRQVIREEIERQHRKPGEVSRSAGVSKNTLYRVLDAGGTVTVDTLWALAGALRVPMPELSFRVDQRRAGRITESGA